MQWMCRLRQSPDREAPVEEGPRCRARPGQRSCLCCASESPGGTSALWWLSSHPRCVGATHNGDQCPEPVSCSRAGTTRDAEMADVDPPLTMTTAQATYASRRVVCPAPTSRVVQVHRRPCKSWSRARRMYQRPRAPPVTHSTVQVHRDLLFVGRRARCLALGTQAAAGPSGSGSEQYGIWVDG